MLHIYIYIYTHTLRSCMADTLQQTGGRVRVRFELAVVTYGLLYHVALQN